MDFKAVFSLLSFAPLRREWDPDSNPLDQETTNSSCCTTNLSLKNSLRRLLSFYRCGNSLTSHACCLIGSPRDVMHLSVAEIIKKLFFPVSKKEIKMTCSSFFVFIQNTLQKGIHKTTYLTKKRFS